MSEEPQNRQEILTNVSVGGNLTTGNITQTIFNTPQHLEGNPFVPPQPREGGLFGREEDLAKLHGLLQSGKNVCVVSGMGGVGKTELVRQYADREECRSHFAGGVFYIDARDRQDLAAEIVALTKWKFKRDLSPDLSPEERVNACWQTWKGQTEQVLLILDDVANMAQKVKPYLPPSDLGMLRLLMTSRESPGKMAVELPLEILLPEPALDLLTSIIGVERVDAEKEQAKLLCQDLGYLPLALELVGCYLDDEDYQDLSLAAMRGKLHAKVTHPALSPEEVPSEMRAKRGIQAAFDLSWDELPSAAKDLACVLGAFASAPIHWDFVTEIYNRRQIETSNPDDLKDRWLKSLRKLHLVIDVAEDIYDLHTLVRDYFGEKFQQHPNHSEIKQAFCDLFAAVASNVEQSSNLTTFNLIEPHLKKMLAWREGKEDTQFALSLNGLALLYYSQGRYAEAEPLLARSLAIREEQLGANHPATATSLNNLAGLYESMGRYAAAEPLYARAWQICEQSLGVGHPNTMTIRGNYARCLRREP